MSMLLSHSKSLLSSLFKLVIFLLVPAVQTQTLTHYSLRPTSPVDPQVPCSASPRLHTPGRRPSADPWLCASFSPPTSQAGGLSASPWRRLRLWRSSPV